VTVHLSWECSRLEEETRDLSEEIAMLRNDFEELRRAADKTDVREEANVA